ncbi:MAG TPA: dephospho-CoA kinase [Polyangiaceae bacterium]|nr:dephospho-CoA kinase [Polyangiaceae bacterium]
MIKVFGLTGGVASGKSTVAQCFAGAGVEVIDADQLARQAVAPGSPGLREVVARFGSQMLNDGGELNRKRLGDVVFSDSQALAQLGAIVHPRVAELFAGRKAALEGKGVQLACYDVPLLFERKLEDQLRPIVVVSVPPQTQLERLMARDHLTAAQAEARLGSQLPLKDKAALADYVIDNSKGREETERQALSVLAAIRAQLNAS